MTHHTLGLNIVVCQEFTWQSYAVSQEPINWYYY